MYKKNGKLQFYNWQKWKFSQGRNLKISKNINRRAAKSLGKFNGVLKRVIKVKRNFQIDLGEIIENKQEISILNEIL